MADVLDTHDKALSINLDAKIYGSFDAVQGGGDLFRLNELASLLRERLDAAPVAFREDRVDAA